MTASPQPQPQRQSPSQPEQPEDGPVIRDKRRIDPETGQLREPAAQPGPAPQPGFDEQPDEQVRDLGATQGPGPGPGGPSAELAAVQHQLADRTADLQRLQAEFTNYRRRVERDREVVRETALANVLANLLPVLDDIGRAREHGELDGGFRAVGEALEAVVGKLGLERYGQAGEPFDPTVHEALTHTYSTEVSEPTAVAVLQPGYRIGVRIIRPARVAVAEPAS